MSINPIFTHIPRTGLAPVAHASRRLRGKSSGVVSIQAKLSTPTARDVLTLKHPDGSARYTVANNGGGRFHGKRDNGGNPIIEACTGTIRKAVATA